MITAKTRRADPVTSRDAARNYDKSGQHARHVDLIAGVIRDHPGLTAAEIGKCCGLSQAQVDRRLSELEFESKLITRPQERRRICAEIKTMALTCWPVKQPEPQEWHCAGKGSKQVELL